VPTIAFLASGWEGIKVRLTVKCDSEEQAQQVLAQEEAEVREILGDVVFGIDDQTMESVVGDMLVERNLTIAFAESLTAGLAAARCADVPGASGWLRGGVVSYAPDTKFELLGVEPGPVVSLAAAEAMADGVRKLLRSSVGVGITGVAGPGESESQKPGNVYVAVAIDGLLPQSAHVRLPGDRLRVRQLSVISALDLVRRNLATLS
jgi:nicotinamide-nucleotide amidase